MNTDEVKRAAKLVKELDALEKAHAVLHDDGAIVNVGTPDISPMGFLFPASVKITRSQAETLLDLVKKDIERELRDLRVTL